MAYQETPDEKQKRQAKEAGWKAEGDKKAKAADDALVNKFKGMIGLGDKEASPTPAPYKKGGKVMSKKAKRYDEGGDVETDTMQGQNANIGDDTRARAMAALQSGKMDNAPAAPAPKAKPSFAAKAKKAGFTSAETGGGAALMTRKMAKGGSASARADGIAQRGKTRA